MTASGKKEDSVRQHKKEWKWKIAPGGDKKSTSAAARKTVAGQTRLRQQERLSAAASGKRRARVQGQEQEGVSKRDVSERASDECDEEVSE